MKDERVKKETLKFVGRIMINSRERILRKHEMIKDKFELSLEVSRVIESFHVDVKLAVRVLNGLSVLDDSFLELGYIPEDPLNMYAYKSILWDGELKSEKISSNVYKARFIMNLLLSIDKFFDIILCNELEYRGSKKNNYEMISLIYQVRDCIGNFIIAFSDNKKSYFDELIKILELTIMIDNFNKDKKFLKVLTREITRLSNMINPGFLDGKRPDDEVLIQNVCLLGFVLSTGSANVKNTFLVPDGTKLKDKESIKTMVEVLGSCIIKRRDEDHLPEMYRWFLQSLPEISYRFTDINYNQALAEGCRALSFVNFFAGDKGISKLISRMIY